MDHDPSHRRNPPHINLTSSTQVTFDEGKFQWKFPWRRQQAEGRGKGCKGGGQGCEAGGGAPAAPVSMLQLATDRNVHSLTIPPLKEYIKAHRCALLRPGLRRPKLRPPSAPYACPIRVGGPKSPSRPHWGGLGLTPANRGKQDIYIPACLTRMV